MADLPELPKLPKLVDVGGAERLTLRFHGELTGLLRPGAGDMAVETGCQTVPYLLTRRASIKDIVEALGVPHSEVYGIRQQGEGGGIERDFAWLPDPGDAAEILPGEPPVNPTIPTLLRPNPLPELRFAADAGVGKLARLLRLLGLDCSYANDVPDPELAAAGGERVVLSTDRGLLRRSAVIYGRLIRPHDPRDQLLDVLNFFGLSRPGVSFTPFTRCLDCNVPLEPVDKALVLDQLEPKTRKYFDTFHRCPACQRVYWPGSHHERMREMLQTLGLRLTPDPY